MKILNSRFSEGKKVHRLLDVKRALAAVGDIIIMLRYRRCLRASPELSLLS